MTTRRTARRGTLAALVTLAVTGTLARFVLLGDRIAHWDEGRMGYDVLRYAATGVFEYRPVTHAPILYHVDRVLFQTLGPSDLIARAPVAVVGGLLPLAAWLYRDHLQAAAVVALGAILAANPVLVYYSRFLRGDVLVGAFAFTALGFLLRTRETGDSRFLYAASTFGALAFASKANALIYAVGWVVAALVVLDQHALARTITNHRLLEADRAKDFVNWLEDRATLAMLVVAVLNPLVVAGAGPFSSLVTGTLIGVVCFVGGLGLDDADRPAHRTAVWVFGGVLAVAVVASALVGSPLAWDSVFVAFTFTWFAAAFGLLGVLTADTGVGATIRRWRAPVTLATILFITITLLMFAPRNPDGLGLWSTITAPTALPALVDAGLIEPLETYGAVWLGGRHNDYLSYAVPLVETLGLAAVVVTVAGVLGFLADRYGTREALVEFALVWAGFSLFVYPIAAVVNAPWHAIHVVVPLSIPAAVAIGNVATRLPAAFTERNVAVAGVGTLVLCVAVAALLTTAAGTAYLHPQSQDNALVQYGQPADDVRETLSVAETAIETNTDGPDVVYYGTYFHVDNESQARSLPSVDLYREDDGDYVLVGENENWYNRLPLPWYFETAGATVDSAATKAGLQDLARTEPAVVVVRSEHADNVSSILEGNFDRETFNLTQRNVTTTVFVDRDAIGTASVQSPRQQESAISSWSPMGTIGRAWRGVQPWTALAAFAIPMTILGAVRRTRHRRR